MMLLIKVVNIDNDQFYIAIRDIVLVKRGMYKEQHCWRVETSGDVVHILPVNDNESFGALLHQCDRYWDHEVKASKMGASAYLATTGVVGSEHS
jgi:hypothetical protein